MNTNEPIADKRLSQVTAAGRFRVSQPILFALENYGLDALGPVKQT